MPKFRKKPVVIEAFRVPPFGPFDPKASADTIDDWGRLWIFLGPGKSWEVADDLGVDIETLEGVMHASPGDWIIKGVKGEYYPCKPDIFEQTYEGYDA